MDSDTSKSLPAFLGPIRPKAQVLMEEWGSLDRRKIFDSNLKLRRQPLPPYETWAKIELPYFTPSAPPIPSMNELIEALKTNSLRARNGITPICRIGNAVIKCGDRACILDEAENILFLAENCPQLHIPKILAVWKDISPEGVDTYCFMMKFIEGLQMDADKFAELPVHVQDIVCAKVSAQIRILRSMPSEGYYGRVHRQGWMSQPKALEVSTEHRICGPFNSYAEIVSAMFYTWVKYQSLNFTTLVWDDTFESDTAELFSLIAGFKPHEPKFTWIDPKPANIVVQPIHKDDGTEDWDVVLIDWEYAGWYPAWVQAMQVEKKFWAVHEDRTLAPYKSGQYPTKIYRKGELSAMVMKDFDPISVQEVLKNLGHLWDFF